MIPVLISGEPGTGRSTAAASMARGETRVIHTAAGIGANENRWLTEVSDALEQADSVVIEGADALSHAAASVLNDLFDLHANRFVIVTGGPRESLPAAARSLVGRFQWDGDLPPLRRRRDAVTTLAYEALQRAGADPGLALSSEVMAILRTYSWPGNLRELHALAARVVSRRTCGVVTMSDLPENWYIAPPARSLSVLEQLERDTIVFILRSCGGNKSQAAKQLGISRATLYSRIRYLGISKHSAANENAV